MCHARVWVIWSLLAVTFWASVSARDTVIGYELLHHGGKSPCDMAKNLKERCPNSETNQDNAEPEPSNCTCTNVFYNLWCACRYSKQSPPSTKPSQWVQKCEDQAIKYTPFPPEAQGVTDEFPSWAYLQTAGDQSWDLLRAVDVAFSGYPPRNLQIIIPVAVGCSVAVLSAVIFIVYATYSKRNRQALLNNGSASSTGNRLTSAFNLSILSNSKRKVKPESRNSSWVIDSHLSNSGVSSSNPAERRIHVRLSSSPTSESTAGAQGQLPDISSSSNTSRREAQQAVPGRTFLTRLAFWKAKPMRVRKRTASLEYPMRINTDVHGRTRKRFDIDESDDIPASALTDSTLENHRLAGWRESGVKPSRLGAKPFAGQIVSTPGKASTATPRNGKVGSTSRYQSVSETIFEDIESDDGSDADGDEEASYKRGGYGFGEDGPLISRSSEPHLPDNETYASSEIFITSTERDESFDIDGDETGYVPPRQAVQSTINDSFHNSPQVHGDNRDLKHRPANLAPTPNISDHSLLHASSTQTMRLRTPPAPSYPAPLPPALPETPRGTQRATSTFPPPPSAPTRSNKASQGATSKPAPSSPPSLPPPPSRQRPLPVQPPPSLAQPLASPPYTESNELGLVQYGYDDSGAPYSDVSTYRDSTASVSVQASNESPHMSLRATAHSNINVNSPLSTSTLPSAAHQPNGRTDAMALYPGPVRAAGLGSPEPVPEDRGRRR